MLLNNIKQENTVAYAIGNGLLAWSNPAINVVLTSDGKVLRLNNGETVPTSPHAKNVGGAYRVGIYCTEGVLEDSKGSLTYTSTSFSGLYARMVLGVKLVGAKVVEPKIETLHKAHNYHPDNVHVVVKNRVQPFGDQHKDAESYNTFKPAPKFADSLLSWMQPDDKSPVLPLVNNLCKEIPMPSTELSLFEPKFYQVTEGVKGFRTEDGAIFPTAELAGWHQDKVSKGKGNAQVVLDYNGGYVMAEALFHQEVTYNVKKPYANFVDVMTNNEGIVCISEPDTASFAGLSTVFINKGINAQYIAVAAIEKATFTIEEAINLQQQLETFCLHAEIYADALNAVKVSTTKVNNCLPPKQ